MNHVIRGLLLLLAGILVGCDGDRALPTAGSAKGVTFDFGIVRLDSGAATLVHEFDVANDSAEPVDIIDVFKTCGCIDAQLGTRALQPGEHTTLTLSFRLSAPGRAGQAVTLFLSNGQQLRFALTAEGVRTRELRAVKLQSALDWQREMALKLYLVDGTTDGETQSPWVVRPAGVTLAFDRWITLEYRSSHSNRPVRQVANVRLNFAGYEGDSPADVRLRTAGGLECVVSVPVDSER